MFNSVPHCPGPEGCSSPSTAALTAKPQDHPGEAKQCRLCGLSPMLWVGLCSSAMAFARSQGCPPARLSQIHQPSVGTSQPALKLPSCQSQGSSRSQAGPLSSDASWKKSTLNKQPAACTLPAENARVLCKNKGNRRALHGPARLPLPQKTLSFPHVFHAL